MFLLTLSNAFSKPKGPISSTEPLSKTLVVCPPNLKIIPVTYLL